MKQENELKKMTFLVLVGAQMYKKERLRNVAKNELKRGKVDLPLKTNAFVASWTKFDDFMLLEFLPFLLEWRGGGRA